MHKRNSKQRPRHRANSKPDKSADRSNLVMGRNLLREVASASPERIEALFVSEAFERELGATEGDALTAAIKERKIELRVLTNAELTTMVHSDSHQGVVARVRPRQRQEWGDFLKSFEDPNRNGLILALDGVTDPHNLGAILRAAECFGVDAVLWSKNRSSGITPVVAKVSVGASELVNCIEVSNLAEAVRRAQKTGFWIVVADSGAGAVAVTEYVFPERSVLILGAEGAGVSHLLIERCDQRVRVPMYGRIDSLNVSQAAAVLLYCARHAGQPA